MSQQEEDQMTGERWHEGVPSGSLTGPGTAAFLGMTRYKAPGGQYHCMITKLSQVKSADGGGVYEVVAWVPNNEVRRAIIADHEAASGVPGTSEAALRCDHDGAFDLVTTHAGVDDLCETPWSWCPKCGTLWERGIQRDPDYIRAALTPPEAGTEGRRE